MKFDPSSPCFIDGSAVPHRFAQKFGRGTSDVTQFRNAAQAVSWGIQVPVELPQTAHFAEHFAVALLACLLESCGASSCEAMADALVVYTDCQSVVLASQKSDAVGSRLVGGIWRDFSRVLRNRQFEFRKIKAHVPRERWPKANPELYFARLGNAIADQVAKECAKTFVGIPAANAAEIPKLWQGVGEWALGRWQGARRQRAAANQVGRMQSQAKNGDAHTWLAVGATFRCGFCGVATREPGTRKGSCQKVRRIIRSVHHTHKSFLGEASFPGANFPVAYAFCVHAVLTAARERRSFGRFAPARRSARPSGANFAAVSYPSAGCRLRRSSPSKSADYTPRGPSSRTAGVKGA